jgi:AcrR family transcriptional regulator
MNTRGKILDQALKMFNERGIEYVGLRELAGVLDIRVGNITYYFATKDDLVFALSLELSKKNEAVIVAGKEITMRGFLDMMQQVFYHHIEFRCLFLSFVHLMEQNKMIAEAYKKTQTRRSSTIKDNLSTLAKSGYIQVKDEGDMDFLVSTLSLISRFWISEAAVSYKHLKPEAQMRHYLALIAKLMLPYATNAGEKDISGFLEGLKNGNT